MSAARHDEAFAAVEGFAPIDNELPMRWYRRLHLAPANGLGTVRRAVFFAALTWLPIFVWSQVAAPATMADSGESLMRHYGVHVRCLLAIPLLVLAEGMLNNVVKHIVSSFITSGTVPPGERPAFDRTLEDLRRMRDASLPWVLVIGLALAWMLVDRPDPKEDTMAWATAGDGGLGFGGWWFAYVARPIFMAMVLGWLWRMVLLAVWYWRVGKLDLSLVPSHPDRTGGIAFVEKLPGAYMLVSLAISSVVVSRWAHLITQHDATLESFKLPAATLLALWTLLALLSLLALAPKLFVTRKGALHAYSALVGEQGRLVHRRWILHEAVDDAPILDAPEIGPVADAASMYDAVKRMRIVPIGKTAMIKILLPVVVPMVVVAALQIPLKTMLLDLLKALT